MRSGGVVSSTVIVNDSGSDSTPLASVLVHVIVVAPSGKVSPDTSAIGSVVSDDVHSIVTGSKKSVALGGSNVTTAPSALRQLPLFDQVGL